MTSSQMGIWSIWRPSLDDISEDFGVHHYSIIFYIKMTEIHTYLSSQDLSTQDSGVVFIHVYFQLFVEFEILD